ncbi:putative disease resistance protein RGA4 [Eucalyptus grandis]|uniref:putative disease resistance protein RGA4 n=1 Tax=Eucalyptus grandis TaxID=71139 RepID=UPI00192E83B7|nr:putative disease resistance protein RGA4 [Eucalyptus grandis]
MAEAVIGSIAEKIIEILGSQAIETVGKLWGIKHELEALKKTVSLLQPVLDDAEEQYHHAHIRIWVEQLKDAFYEAQDVLEEFNIEAMRQELRGHNERMKAVRTFFSSSNQLAFKLKMSDKVRVVRVRIEAFKANRIPTLKEHPKKEWRNREETHSFIREEDIKGREDDKEIVMKFLLDSNMEENVSILPIVGIGGLGKTALAKYVYGDKTWLSLKTSLVEGAKGSKILITTRLPSMAKITGTTPPHFLGGLSESTPFDLLMQMACCNKEELQDPDMLVIGKDIVRKCCGVPLVVRTVGSLLFFKKTKSEWLHFKEYDLLKVSQNEECIKQVLKLSYDHLPSHLKQCFALCSLFPKDYELKKQTLVDLWMAEGFIRPSDRGQHLEDIAHGYFMDLLWSNFFQEFQEDVGTCKMHDLMHDLACSVAGTECWVAWDDTKHIHERTHHISYDSTFNFMSKFPISQVKASALRTFLSVTRYWERDPMIEVDLRRLIQSFKRLRILDLHAANVEKVPRSIGKLKYLTYLDLSYNEKLKRLPNSITRLQKLQKLNLKSCSKLKELPRDIRKLVSLRNLDIDDCNELSYMPCGLGQLSSLHRLSCFILPKDKALAKKYCGLGELNRLNNIRGALSIENLGSVTNAVEESQAANLREKSSLEVLGLSWGNVNITDEAIAMITKRDEALLDGLRPPDNLQKLIIKGYNDCPNFKELSEQIEKCEELDISKDESGNILDFHGGLQSLRSVEIEGLPALTSLPQWLLQARNLERLTIWSCRKLKDIPEQIEALQSLQNLVIIQCPSLTSFPEAMRRLTSLTHLTIYRCPKLEESCKRQAGKDWDKIAHIPHIRIDCRSCTNFLH